MELRCFRCEQPVMANIVGEFIANDGKPCTSPSGHRVSSTLVSQAAALTTFLETFDYMTLNDIGPHLSCIECEAMAILFEVHSLGGAAKALREGHAAEDEEGDMPKHLELKEQLEKEG